MMIIEPSVIIFADRFMYLIDMNSTNDDSLIVLMRF